MSNTPSACCGVVDLKLRACLKVRRANKTIPEMMKKLLLNTRAVFDYLKMTRNFNTLSMT
ncbi:MAG: hypothetical protein KZQ61_00170 [Candidatus Thiodiazotropha sp. (ex Lucinoma aequizonata)]|nr:hypothetical protein [Candidatus Thiodiazotropha sp. (ex Lucinoma aequizonata)]